MTELLNIPVTALRCAWQHINEGEQAYQGIYTLENNRSMREPLLQGSWIGLNELTQIALAVEGQPCRDYTLSGKQMGILYQRIAAPGCN